MNRFVRSWPVSFVGICAVLQLFLLGCAAGSKFQRPVDDQALAADALHRYLDRWVGWRSLTASVRFTLSTGDTTVTAKGHILYLLGERFELGFVKPYNRFLGNFYITPSQFVYWDVGATPHAFSAQDTVNLGQLIPIPVPNWDPRDLLPFPVSGRTGGFQPDSMRSEGKSLVIYGVGDGAAYRLNISKSTGLIEQEWVSRAGHEPMLKKYSKTRTMSGWPVAVRVTCTDESGEFALDWSLKGVSLEAEPYHLPTDSTSTRSIGSMP